MHTHFFYFSIFLFFYFFIFFIFLLFMFLGAGPSSAHVGAGLDPASPARPGHWPKPVTRLGQTKQEARVGCLHDCMHCAKVINLPSRSAILLTKWGKDEKNESWLTCAQRSRDAMKDFGSLPSSSDFVPFTLCFRSSSLLLSLSSVYSFRLCWKWLRQWPTFSFFA